MSATGTRSRSTAHWPWSRSLTSERNPRTGWLGSLAQAPPDGTLQGQRRQVGGGGRNQTSGTGQRPAAAEGGGADLEGLADLGPLGAGRDIRSAHRPHREHLVEREDCASVGDSEPEVMVHRVAVAGVVAPDGQGSVASERGTRVRERVE